MLRVRALKDRLLSLLNYFRSVERTLTIDSYGFAAEDKFQFSSEHTNRTLPLLSPSPFTLLQTHTVQEKMNDGSSSDNLQKHKHINNYLPTDYEADAALFMRFDGAERRDDLYAWRSYKDDCGFEENEIEVVDVTNSKVLYDAAVQDFLGIQRELLALGTLVVNCAREDPANHHTDQVDRWGMLCDLFEGECMFQGAKARLLEVYLKLYENAISSRVQRKMAEKMEEIIIMRPNLDITERPRAFYFTHCYAAHVEGLNTLTSFLNNVFEWQIQRERSDFNQTRDADWRPFNAKLPTSGLRSFWTSYSKVAASKDRPHDVAAASRETQSSTVRRQSFIDMALQKQKNLMSGAVGGPSSLPEYEINGKPLPSLAGSQAKEDEANIDASNITDVVKAELESVSLSSSSSPFARGGKMGLLEFYPGTSVVLKVHEIVDSNALRLFTSRQRPHSEFERSCVFQALVESMESTFRSFAGSE
jgi:hypothetical protein